jgi:hypothetical protein
MPDLIGLCHLEKLQKDLDLFPGLFLCILRMAAFLVLSYCIPSYRLLLTTAISLPVTLSFASTCAHRRLR